jgi:integrase
MENMENIAQIGGFMRLHPDDLDSIADRIAAKMASGGGVNYIDDVDASSLTEGGIMAVKQVKGKRNVWKVDVPYRKPDGTTSRLKATVEGTRQEAEAKEMELKAKARGETVVNGNEQIERLENMILNLSNQLAQKSVEQPVPVTTANSLKFSEVVDKYIAKQSKTITKDIEITLLFLKRELGKECVDGHFKDKFLEWLETQKNREIQRYRVEDGKKIYYSTGKKLSAGTIQWYVRYTSVMLNSSKLGRFFEGVVIGKPVVRRRAISDSEMEKLEKSCLKLFPWFFPAFDFARKCPIRPSDQFVLNVEEHVIDGEISYKPRKTYNKTGLMAFPILYDEGVKEYVKSVNGGLLFPRPDSNKTLLDAGKYYQTVWKKIRADAGLADISFYDLRHHAVTYLRSRNVSDWRIIKACGYADGEMLAVYDTNNPDLIRDYDKKQLAK